MMRKARLPAAALLLLVLLLLLAGGTYAWFTFRPDVTVTPLHGTVSGGSGNLLISTAPEGPFAASCALRPVRPGAELQPLSTADLVSFYAVKRLDQNGVARSYRRADAESVEHTLSGVLYLRAEDSDFDLYLWLPGLDAGTDPQALAALRLGLELRTQLGVQRRILRLDALGDTAEALSRQSVPTAGTVVAGCDADGRPDYVPDPAAEPAGFAAAGSLDAPEPGPAPLGRLTAGETAELHYILYLEGCDEHCINAVQARELALALAFAGVPRTAAAPAEEGAMLG